MDCLCFTLPDGTSMLVKHLKSYTREQLMAFVESKEGITKKTKGDGYSSPPLSPLSHILRRQFTWQEGSSIGEGRSDVV
jgi:hypothetical protein